MVRASRLEGWGLLCAAGALGMGALIGGCAPNQVSFFIVQNQVPMQTGLGGPCTTSADPTALSIGDGVLDLSVANTYNLNPLYRSELITTADRGTGTPEMRGMFVDGANIEVHADSATGPLINVSDAAGMVPAIFSVAANTFIDAASTSAPGLAIGTLQIVPPRLGSALAASLMADGGGPACEPIAGSSDMACPVPQWPSFSKVYVIVVKPFGHTMGGLEISGSEFDYPINFCCHCLVEFMAGIDNPDEPGPNCDAANTSLTMGACNVGQDFAFSCQECSGSNVSACEPRGFRANGGSTVCPL